MVSEVESKKMFGPERHGLDSLSDISCAHPLQERPGEANLRPDHDTTADFVERAKDAMAIKGVDARMLKEFLLPSSSVDPQVLSRRPTIQHHASW